MRPSHKICCVVLAFFAVAITVCWIVYYPEENINDISKLIAEYRSGKVDINKDKLLELSKSRNSMVRYYVVNSMGDLGSGGVAFLENLATLLSSADPFMRDAAAHSVLKLAPYGRINLDVLLRTIYKYVNESAARYAVETIGIYGNGTQEILDCLRYAYDAKDSDCRQASANAYKIITGNNIDQHTER